MPSSAKRSLFGKQALHSKEAQSIKVEGDRYQVETPVASCMNLSS